MTISMRSNGPRNRLSRETSPYLLLHSANPVDWYPWGEDAFARAAAEDRPIFLSVGYSTCHWCHVMARECFSDPEIARQMNEGFVCIKVDREERPDVDETYMAATQLITRQGGWPNSVFLTPDLKPFFAGTYFPPRDMVGRPGFPRVLTSVREAWALQRGQLLQQAEAIAQAIQAQLEAAAEPTEPPSPEAARTAKSALAQRFDRQHGGFGRAPKFPSPANLYLLLDLAHAGDQEAGEMLVATLDCMARGGLRDHVAGGFHRYSVDAEWLVPHFEKMLYDNATLVELYAEGEALAPDRGFADVALSTAEFLLDELSSPDGGFLSAMDAESGGEEGASYVWTRDELRSVLGDDDALLARVWGFDGAPNFEGDRYVLHLPRPVSDAAREAGLDLGALALRMEAGKDRLLAARSGRVQPVVDDKVLADWNGLAIAGLALAGVILGVPMLVEAAAAAAGFVLDALVAPDRILAHSWRDGQASVPAFLDDYAFLVRGLLRLFEATEDEAFRDEAERLLAEQERRLADPWGGYYFSGEDARLLVRSRPAHDGASLSGNGAAALNLLDLALLTGRPELRQRAERVLAAFGAQVSSMPAACPTLARAALRLSAAGPSSPVLVVPSPGRPEVAGEGEAESLEDLAREVVDVRGSIDAGYDSWRRFRLELSIVRGWHITGHSVAQGGARVAPVLGSLRNLTYPPGERWTGKVSIEGEVAPPEFGAPSLELTYQPCDDSRCLPSVERLVRLQ